MTQTKILQPTTSIDSIEDDSTTSTVADVSSLIPSVAVPSPSASFLATIANRRSIYTFSSSSTISDEQINGIVKTAILHTPSSFNSQSGRAVVLLKEQHHALWDIVARSLQAAVPSEVYDTMKGKLASFQAGYGTVLFFEDQEAVRGLQEKFPSYAHNFPLWSQQSSGMLQLIVWTAFEAEGLGASLQHYSNLIEAEVKSRWSLPSSWTLMSQMPFGTPTASPNQKTFTPIEDRFRSY
eukprot:TRINITY_DN16109_c0_g1_i1.p1 TRINITY_DN16109_c0_g1~~TRINITY_DN16109_c0_g1_i1.p1  ORF type:complete len:238 (-),score=64.42 TRINITY_DN16109_c0_g1_i1:40-753(-)